MPVVEQLGLLLLTSIGSPSRRPLRAFGVSGHWVDAVEDAVAVRICGTLSSTFAPFSGVPGH